MPNYTTYHNVNWSLLLRNLLPIDWRKSPLIPFVFALIYTIAQVHASFKLFRHQTALDLGYNSQVCHLTRALNDSYDPYYRRIYIKNTNVTTDMLFLYFPQDDEPLHLYDDEPLHMYGSTDYNQSAVDFTVHVPATLWQTIDEPTIRALIDKHKLFSKHYNFQTF